MPSYTIFRHPQGRLLAVSQEWHWPAFLYGPLWALHYRHWRVLACCMGYLLVCALLGRLNAWFAGLAASGFYFGALIGAVTMALMGFELEARRLRRLGCVRVAVSVEAVSARDALDRHRAARQASNERRRKRKAPMRQAR